MNNRNEAIKEAIESAEYFETRGADDSLAAARDVGASFGIKLALSMFGVRRIDKHAYRDGDNVYTYDKETHKVTKERRPE